DALLIESRLRAAGTDHRVGRSAEYGADSARSHYYRVGCECLHFESVQMHCHETASYAVVVENCREKFPPLIFVYDIFGFVTAHLLIQCVEQLLSRSRAGISRAVKEGAAKASEIYQALRGAIERHAHTIEHVDDRGRHLTHRSHRRLIGKIVASIDCV